MKVLVVIFAALAGTVVGWIAAAAAVIALGGTFGLSNFEGERAMTAVFGIGPVGGLIGLIAGVWLVLRK